MARHSDAQVLRLGTITLVVMALIMAAAINLSKFPGFSGTTYQAWFAEGSGLRAGNMVQVGGIRSGRVQGLELVDDRVLVTFEVDNDVDFGTESRASVEVLNLLGEKYLQLDPAGPGQQSEDEPIPLERTDSAYDIVGVFGDLTTTTEELDTDQLDLFGDLDSLGKDEASDASALTQTVPRRRAAPVRDVAPSNTKASRPSRRLRGSRRLMKVVLGVLAQGVVHA